MLLLSDIARRTGVQAPLFGLAAGIFLWAVTAAFVRRLHDLDRTGWWFLAPLAFWTTATFALGAWGGASRLTASEANLGGFILFFLTACLYLILLTLLLAWPGDPALNRFGPAPVERLAQRFGIRLKSRE